ncbi:MAG: Lpg1974 family pore-forming outer membrane protein [Gammaproteobacteria bacterium]
MLIKLSKVLLLLCAATTIAYAGAPGNNMVPPSGVALIAPSTPGMWTVGLEATMLMPIDKFQYMQAVLPQPDGSTIFHNESVDNQPGFGWGVNVGYQFANTGRDITVAFMTDNTGDSEAYSVPVGTILYGPNGRSNPLQITDGGNAVGTADYRYRAADLTMGQLFTIGQRVTLHPFAGLRYAYLSVDGDASYNHLSGEVDQFDSDSIFNGAGPRIGVNAAVHLWWGFSIVGTAGASVLIGDISDPYKVIANAQNSAITTTTKYDSDDNTTVIPELDESLGLDYQYAFAPTTILDAQFGVQMLNYFNGDQHDFVSTVDTNSSLAEQDFGLHGLYLRAQMSFA